MKYFIIIFFNLFSFAYAMPPNAIEGLWKTYDLKNHPRTIIKFYRVNNEYRADIYKILDKTKYSEICEHCKGSNKNHILEGMTIIQGLQFSNAEWKNGAVLDTDSGNTYGCQITLSENKTRMFFRAFIKYPMLGKTLRWERVEA